MDGMKENNKEIKRGAEAYLVEANPDELLCIDEREYAKEADAEHYAPKERNGIKLPGGIFGVVDAVKQLRQVSEDEAWKIVEEAGIPLMGHDDEHHEEKGCGYEKLVETQPEAVLAQEPVGAKVRLEKLKSWGGKVLRYLGGHNHTGSVINRRFGMTVDQDEAAKDGVRPFVCDSWIAQVWGPKLGIDADKLQKHWEEVHNSTVKTLTAGNMGTEEVIN